MTIEGRTHLSTCTLATALVCVASGLGAFGFHPGKATAQRAKPPTFEWPGRFKALLKKLGSESTVKKMAALSRMERYPLKKIERPLLTLLEDAKWKVRQRAASILVDKGSKKVVWALVTWLNDFETKHRVRAIELLGKTKRKTAVIPIVRALRDFEPEVRMASLQALGKMKASSALTAVLGRLDDDSVKVRLAAVTVLGVIPHPRAVITLMGKLGDSAKDVRKKVIETLGTLGDPRSAPAVLRTLKDPVQEIRQAAARALGNLASAEAVAALMRLLRGGSSVGIRRAAAASLAQIGTPKAARALVEALSNPQIRTIASANIRVLGKAAVPSTVERLKETRVPPGEAETLVTLLSDIGDGRASKALITELDRQRVDARKVITALKVCGDSSALIPLLRHFGKAKNDALSLRILDALEPIIDGRAEKPLMETLDTKNDAIRTRIVKLLGRLKTKRAVPKIITFLKTSNKTLRLAAIRALGLIGDSRAEKALAPLLTSIDDRIRMEAADAMGRAAAPESARRLMKQLNNNTEWTSKTRAAHMKAIGTLLRRQPDQATLQALVNWARRTPLDLSMPALEALQAARSTKVTPLLLKLFNDKKTAKEKKIKIIEILGDSKHSKALSLLLQSLRSRKNVALSATAAWALRKMGDTRALSHLLKRWKRARHPAVQINITAAVSAMSKKSRGAAFLWKRLSHKNLYVRLNALLGLSRSVQKKKRKRFFRAAADVGAKTVNNSYLARHTVRVLKRMGAPKSSIARAKSSITMDVSRRSKAKWRHLHKRSKLDWIAFQLTDRTGKPSSGKPFLLILGDGTTRAGFSGPFGRTREEGIPVGSCFLEMPRTWPKL